MSGEAAVDGSRGEDRAQRLAPRVPPQTQLLPVLYNKVPPVRPVSLRRCLLDLRRDPVSGLALGPTSAALSFLLPVYDLERNGPFDSGVLQLQLDRITAREPRSGGQFACHVTGSSIERLSVPPYTERQGGAIPEYRTADVDVMVELKALTVSPRLGAGPIYMNTTLASHRGYTRVVVEPAVAQANPIFCSPVSDNDVPQSFLSIERVNDTLKEELRVLKPQMSVDRQGPSVNVQEPGSIVYSGSLAYINDMDLVPALPLAEQPAELADWLERVRGRCWPPEPLRAEIGRSGRCFLVGAGHASSAQRDLEWRLSFSEPERRLALSLTPQQRKVYVLTKMMQKCYLQQPKVLVTYHIKTLMFWELEECGDVDWSEEELFSRLLALLDRIQSCLERHCIPSYFIPENNLISHVSAEDVSTVLSIVRQIRHRPLQHLYGIDDRFRFDFSSPRPLSELHAPLRRLLLVGGGGGAEAAEALTISLIEQAQADVRRGVAEQGRCARLLHSAWEALAASGGPEGAPHPVHDDWLMFAAAAAFIAMGADESVWAMQALVAVTSDSDRPSATVQIPTGALKEVGHLMPRLDGGKGKDGDDDQLKQIIDGMVRSGVVEIPSPVFTVLHLRHAQLELMRDLKHRQLEKIADMPPHVSIAAKTRSNLSVIDLTYKFKVKCGFPQEAAIAEVIQKTTALAQELYTADGGRSLTGLVQSAVAAAAADVGADPARSNQQELTTLTSQVEKFEERVKPTADNPTRLPFERNTAALNIIPLHMIHMYQRTFSGELTEDDLDDYYTPFFNMMGFFLKHKLYTYAFRTTGLMTCLWLTSLECELRQVVYDLNRATLYVQQLPTAVRDLLRLTSGRAVLEVVYRFIELMHRAFDAADQLDGLLTGDAPQQQLDKLETAIAETVPFVPDDVELTHRVMRLCVLKVLGRDAEDDISDVGGSGVAEAARDILDRWHPSESMPAPANEREAPATEAAATEREAPATETSATEREAPATETSATE